ncbi:MAG: recombinase family protein [Bdellovibrionales bacterium]
MKAIILARISTKEQQDGHSLEAQVNNLTQYAERNSFTIIRQFTLVESSTKRQRPEFDQMITFIKEHEQKIALIVDTVDRLQRSFRETPILNDLMEDGILELHFVKEGNILSNMANSAQKLMWNMGVMMAQSYTDQLSDNVKRSINFKIRNGEWCGQAPLGYINSIDSRSSKATITPDPASYEMIRGIFIDYASGTYSLAELARKYHHQGLRSKAGNEIRTQQLHKLIQNPFYWGVMVIKGKQHSHHYQPLITKTLFDTCQLVLNSRGRTQAVKDTKQPYLYRGIVKCAVSDRQVTCDLKKKKYVYLICRDPDDENKKLWVKQKDVDVQIEKKLTSLRLSKSFINEVFDYISASNDTEQRIVQELTIEQNNIDNQVDRLTNLLIDRTITKDVYDRKIEYLHAKRLETDSLLSEYKNCDEEYEIALNALMRIAHSSLSLFKSSKMVIQRGLLLLVFSNLQLEGCKLRSAWREPFNSMRRMGDNLAVRTSN